MNNTYPILLAVRTEFAEEHPKVVVKVLKALIRATRFIHEHPKEVATMLANLTGMPAEAVEKTMGYHYYQVKLDEEVKNSLSSMATFLKDIGKSNELPNWDEVMDDSYLDEALKELGQAG